MITAFSLLVVAGLGPKQDVVLSTPSMKLAISVPTDVDGWKLKRGKTDTSTKLVYENSALSAFGKPSLFTFDFRPKASQVRLLDTHKKLWSQMKPNPKYLKMNSAWEGWTFQERADGMLPGGIKVTMTAQGESLFVIIEGTYPGPLDRASTSKLVVLNNKLTRAILPNGKIKAL